MSQGHSERAHALLGASSASRWINCPPSARLTDGMEEKRSEYADEGTAAHELAELKLRKSLVPVDAKERKRIDKAIKDFKKNQYYGTEMENAVEAYVDLITERYNEAKARSADAQIFLEERLDFSEWTAPDQFGTGDVTIIADGMMEIIDLKYGKGVMVSAVNNAQLRLYALGAIDGFGYLYDVQTVRMTIVQPRLDHVSSDDISTEDLIDWGLNVVKPAAELAYAGEGEFKAGDHCRWCKVKATCRARADQNMEALAYEFKDPALLDNEEIGSILFIAEQLSAWAKDITSYAHEQALKGQKFPNWKLVEGRSNRKITDPDEAGRRLGSAGVMEFLRMSLLPLGELEKKVGKKELAKLLDGLIIKPQGKPVLVPATDKREELNSIEGDFAGEEFSE